MENAQQKNLSDRFITVRDADNRDVTISLRDWLDKFLFPGIENKWDSADDLYRLIIASLDDDIAEYLIPASERLLTIDHIRERAHTVYGIVLMRSGKIDEAANAFIAGIKEVGQTSVLLINLAKAFSAQGDSALAAKTIWMAVTCDPNLEDGLMCLIFFSGESYGKEGRSRALRSVMELENSWRARLWLGCDLVDIGRIDEACALFGEVLANQNHDAMAPLMMSSHLVGVGELKKMLNLIGPAFNEHKHEPRLGLNLITAAYRLKKPNQGEALISRMYALGLNELKPHLDELAQAFKDMRASAGKGG